jgi:hypothetical protein
MAAKTSGSHCNNAEQSGWRPDPRLLIVTKAGHELVDQFPLEIAVAG